jgi:hypothetical protein
MWVDIDIDWLQSKVEDKLLISGVRRYAKIYQNDSFFHYKYQILMLISN